MVNQSLSDKELNDIQTALLRCKMKRSVALNVYCISIDHRLVQEQSTDVSMATSSSQVQTSAFLAGHSFNVNVLANQCFQDIAMTFICGIVQSSPAISTFSVNICYLK